MTRDNPKINPTIDNLAIDHIGSSEWTLDEARNMAVDLAGISDTEDEELGTRLLVALIDHLDRLAGRDRLSVGENVLLHPADRARAAAVITELRADAEAAPSALVINTRMTISAGRATADRLASLHDQPETWQGNVGRALLGVYALLDELYGGHFGDPLSPEECAAVAGTVGPAQLPSAFADYASYP